MKINTNKIPEFVKQVSQTLEEAGFETYLVGGAVRDLLTEDSKNVEPKDFDLTTKAKPEEIINLFPKTVYENTFGTVLVCVPKLTADSQKLTASDYESVEVTPFRTEGKYTDMRHPDSVSFSDKVEDDLKRRDFTVNAFAYRLKTDELIDLYEGKKDLENKILKTVGDPDERFTEDPLRLMRAIRFATSLNFMIEPKTMESIIKNADLIKHISIERIRDEFVKIINSNSPATGVEMLRRFGLLKYFIPELLEGVDCHQGGAHKYNVYEHLLHALKHAADKNFPSYIRIAALFHDIGKPRSKREGVAKISTNTKFSKKINSTDTLSSSSLPTNLPSRSSSERVSVALDSEASLQPKTYNLQPSPKPTFYGHEVIGARMAKKIMERMKFPKDEIDLVYKFVRYHMFFSDTEVITLSPVRRMIQNVGVDRIWELMQIRECDRVGMDKNEAPYRLRKYHAMIEEALRDPISVKQLKVNGEYLIKELNIKPGPRMGWILHALLEEVLEDPKLNTVEILSQRVRELDKLTDKELKILGEQGKDKREELEGEEVKKLHKKHGV